MSFTYLTDDGHIADDEYATHLQSPPPHTLQSSTPVAPPTSYPVPPSALSITLANLVSRPGWTHTSSYRDPPSPFTPASLVSSASSRPTSASVSSTFAHRLSHTGSLPQSRLDYRPLSIDGPEESWGSLNALGLSFGPIVGSPITSPGELARGDHQGSRGPYAPSTGLTNTIDNRPDTTAQDCHDVQPHYAPPHTGELEQETILAGGSSVTADVLEMYTNDATYWDDPDQDELADPHHAQQHPIFNAVNGPSDFDCSSAVQGIAEGGILEHTGGQSQGTQMAGPIQENGPYWQGGYGARDDAVEWGFGGHSLGTGHSGQLLVPDVAHSEINGVAHHGSVGWHAELLQDVFNACGRKPSLVRIAGEGNGQQDSRQVELKREPIPWSQADLDALHLLSMAYESIRPVKKRTKASDKRKWQTLTDPEIMQKYFAGRSQDEVKKKATNLGLKYSGTSPKRDRKLKATKVTKEQKRAEAAALAQQSGGSGSGI